MRELALPRPEGRRELRNQLDSDVNEEIINRATRVAVADRSSLIIKPRHDDQTAAEPDLQPCLSSTGMIHTVHAGHTARRLYAANARCCSVATYLFEWVYNDVLRVRVRFQDPATSASTKPKPQS